MKGDFGSENVRTKDISAVKAVSSDDGDSEVWLSVVK